MHRISGGFPLLIAMTAMLCASGGVSGGFIGALVMCALILLAVAVTLGVSRVLGSTILAGEPSHFALELPPYRKPKLGRVIVHSLLDRTLFVLARAAAVAAPAGVIIWLGANIDVGGMSILARISEFLDPFGRLIGVDGVILCAFILGLPANEIVLPLALMIYSGEGRLGDTAGLSELLAAVGWNELTCICVMLLSVFHFPCSTTLLTIKKETGSLGLTLLAAVIPTVIGILLCLIVTCIYGNL